MERPIEITLWIIVLFGLCFLLVAAVLTGHYDKQFRDAMWEIKSPAERLVSVGSGIARWNPDSNFHIIIGYDLENIVILAPPNSNVIANGHFSSNKYFDERALIIIGGE